MHQPPSQAAASAVKRHQLARGRAAGYAGTITRTIFGVAWLLFFFLGCVARILFMSRRGPQQGRPMGSLMHRLLIPRMA